jgi:hypothetical protein
MSDKNSLICIKEELYDCGVSRHISPKSWVVDAVQPRDVNFMYLLFDSAGRRPAIARKHSR